jgi:hypothetical protein
MFNKFLKLTLVAFVLLAVFFPVNTHAQIFQGVNGGVCLDDAGNEIKGPGGKTLTEEECGSARIANALADTKITAESNIGNLILKYVNFSLPYLALAAFLGFVYAGFLYVTAYGADEQVQKSKKILIYSVLGLIVVILSFGIVNLLTKELVSAVK